MKFNVDDLIAAGLVSKKTYKYGEYAGLSVLKYKNNVFWDNMWHKDPRLLDCRGMVVDADDNVVIWPFTKIFNRFENSTDVSLDKLVTASRKVNGFMAAAAVHNGKLLVSTTGTLDSEFANIARMHIEKAIREDGTRSFEHFKGFVDSARMTLMFEICDDNDPHIVKESPGAYLIGARLMNTKSQVMLPEGALDGLATVMGFKRPQTWTSIEFHQVVLMAKKCNHEGFVVRDNEHPSSLLLKIKSPHYLVKKFLMRGGDGKWDVIWNDPQTARKRVEEEYYPLLSHIRAHFAQEDWAKMDSQERRKHVEEYFSGIMD